MINKANRTYVLMGILGLFMLFGATAAEAKCVPKIDNFIFLVDQSGTMYDRCSKDCGNVTKMAVAKRILSGLNDLIPEAGEKGALYLYSPFKPVVTPRVHSRATLGEGIRSIPDSQPIWATPMGVAFSNLDPVLAGLTGKTAIIIVSDGMEYVNPCLVCEAAKIYAKYPNVCIDIISLADTKEGKQTLSRLNKLNGCSVLCDGCDLIKDSSMKCIMDIFCSEQAETMTPKAQTMILRGIHFDFNKYDIKQEWAPILDEAASMLRAHPEISVVIGGHTDGVGSVPYNQVLSEHRAAAVRTYLERKGISGHRMTAEGFGKMKPIADNNTDQGRAMNRRVELHVQ